MNAVHMLEADQHFNTKVKCPTGWAPFGSNSKLLGAKLQSNARGKLGEMGGFGIDWYIR